MEDYIQKRHPMPFAQNVLQKTICYLGFSDFFVELFIDDGCKKNLFVMPDSFVIAFSAL